MHLKYPHEIEPYCVVKANGPADKPIIGVWSQSESCIMYNLQHEVQLYYPNKKQQIEVIADPMGLAIAYAKQIEHATHAEGPRPTSG